MLPEWLIEFLHKNPYPSLSFLDVKIPTTEQHEVMFFYQHKEDELEKLEGNILINFEFYEEPQAYIMHIAFHPNRLKELKTKTYRAVNIEFSLDYVETEFMKKDLHIEALKSLAKQENFTLFLYDKNTGYVKQKLIDFREGQLLLNEFIKTNNI